MIPKSYTIGNFKAIGLPQTIDLRPITLIFGKNSAGKSSIIQSLLLCRHALEKGNFNFTSTKRWGQTIDLGGFRQYIHRHDSTNDLNIGFTFERSKMEKGNEAVESQVERISRKRGIEDMPPPWSFPLFNESSEIGVRFIVGFPPEDFKSQKSPTPVVKECVISIDSHDVLFFTLASTGRLELKEADLNHLAGSGAMAHLAKAFVKARSGEEDSPLSLLDVTEIMDETPSLREFEKRTLEMFNSVLESANFKEEAISDILSDTDSFAKFIWNVESRLLDELRAPGRAFALEGKGLDLMLKESWRLPSTRRDVVEADEDDNSQETGTELGKAVEVEAIEDPLTFFRSDPKLVDEMDALAKAFRFDLELVVDSIFDTLKHWLIGTEYIGPYRAIPGRYFQIAEAEDSETVDQGYQTLREIAHDPKLLNQISDIFQETLDSPYRLEVRTVAPSLDVEQLGATVQRYLEKETSENKDDLRTGVSKAIAEFSEGKTTKGVYLVDTRNNTDVDFCDVGFGIGQVLPLIAEVASERTGIVCIEQPEVHLHPKMQSDLADVFVREKADMQGGRQNLFILETHSEHIILRLLRRIRETSRKKLPPGVAETTPEDISVAWVEAGKEGSVFTPLKIDKQGRFIDDWPAGFFEERLDEMF